MTEKNRKTTRLVLMVFGPLIVLTVAGWFYITGGRYISTENAYVKTDIVSVVPEVSGLINSVNAEDNELVQRDGLLFIIDPAPFKIEVDKAKAELVNASIQINAQKARYQQKEESVAIAQSDYELAKKLYDRRSALAKQNSTVISPEEMDDVAHSLSNAEKRVTLLQQEKEELLVLLGGDPSIAVENHPLYKTAKAALDRAELNLRRTQVYAPADGVIRHAPTVGSYAQAGLPSTNLATAEKTWIEANYKETELTTVHAGQSVEIKIDTYPDHSWTGTVESISPATESEFSILPAQNTTGNWVKVVQRIPVRISIDTAQDAPSLRAGMSTEVTIDTGSWPHMPGFMKALF